METAIANSSDNMLPEANNAQNEADAFVQNLRRRQKKNKKKKSETLKERIANAPSITDSMIESFFTTESEYSVPEQVITEVKNVLRGMQNKINKLPASKRLFILETVDLFTSKISIGKLIPALLILTGFCAYTGGIPIEVITGNNEMKNLGFASIVLGIFFYIVELIISVYNSSRG